jgi:GTP-binding protein
VSRPVVAIVGRPNVGKSTLFNRLVGDRIAIVESEPGVTRDRIYQECQWLNKIFFLVDTGGIEPFSGEMLQELAQRQAQMAVDEADLVLFVVDVKTGVSASDLEVANILRKSGKPVILTANKVDNPDLEMHLADLYQLGMGDPMPVSAEHGRYIGDLLDKVISSLPDDDEDDRQEDITSIAIMGRPNVGKSSLVNSLVGGERMIVSDIPGTTRDAVDTDIIYNEKRYRLIDTAGIRRQGRIQEDVERYSVLRAIKAAQRSQVCVVILDAVDKVTEQDERIAGIPHESGKGVLLVVNKWDLIEKDGRTMQEYDRLIRNQLAYLDYAPILYISSKTGQRITQVLEMAEYIAQQCALRIPTGKINEVIQEAVAMHQPPSSKGKRLKILYMSQVAVQPPHFVMFVNEPELLHFSYKRYLETQLRKAFGFVGTPIVITTRRRGE